MNARGAALARHLGADPERVTQAYWSPCEFLVEPALSHEQRTDPCLKAIPGHYYVLTPMEADTWAAGEIPELLRKTSPSFLVRHINYRYKEEAEALLAHILQSEAYDDSFLKALIEDMDCLIGDALATYGRGLFLAAADGKESECDGYFIYLVEASSLERQAPRRRRA